MAYRARSHLIIPDTQVKPGEPFDHLRWIGRYIVDKKPDVIIHLGDHADMPSLSSYDRGKAEFEGRRYKADINAAREAMRELVRPMVEHNKASTAQYSPRMLLTLGNHENRIDRMVSDHPELQGTLGIHNLAYREFGWEVHDFLDIVEVDGIRYSHFFPRSPSGRVMQSKRGCPSASAQVKREMVSCTSGHLQGLDWSIIQGVKRRYGLIAGSCYLHDEKYLGPQGNDYWRGIIVKHDVRDGEYDPMFVSLNFLCRKYEGVELSKYEPKRRYDG